MVLSLEATTEAHEAEEAPTEEATTNLSEPLKAECPGAPAVEAEEPKDEENLEQPAIGHEAGPESEDKLGQDDYEVIQPEEAPIELAEKYPSTEVLSPLIRI